MITVPFTIPCKLAEIPHKSSAFEMMPRMNIPANVPQTDALPPDMLVPPIITAAIASSSYDKPAPVELIESRRPANIIALNPVSSPIIP